MKKESSLLSLVLPVYNEELHIVNTLETLNSFLTRHFRNRYEIIIIDDGSTDNSAKLVMNQIIKHRSNKLLINHTNQGRGYSVKKGFKIAKGEIFGFIDSDLEVKPIYILDCVRAISKSDISVVSKYHKSSRVDTPFIRRAMSKVFYIWIQMLLDKELADHQGGLKLMKRGVARKILPLIKSKRWLFDLELLYYAKKYGLVIKKVPLTIRYGYGRFNFNSMKNFGLDFVRSFSLVLKLKANRK